MLESERLSFYPLTGKKDTHRNKGGRGGELFFFENLLLHSLQNGGKYCNTTKWNLICNIVIFTYCNIMQVVILHYSKEIYRFL